MDNYIDNLAKWYLYVYSRKNHHMYGGVMSTWTNFLKGKKKLPSETLAVFRKRMIDEYNKSGVGKRMLNDPAITKLDEIINRLDSILNQLKTATVSPAIITLPNVPIAPPMPSLPPPPPPPPSSMKKIPVKIDMGEPVQVRLLQELKQKLALRKVE